MSQFNNFYEYWEKIAQTHSDNCALKDDYLKSEYTYNQAFEAIKHFSNGLKTLGLKKGDHIALFSENSAHWMIADQAILTSGIVDAVRGSAASNTELCYIIEHSDSTAIIVEDLKLLRRLNEDIKNLNLKFIIYLSNETPDENEKFSHKIYSFDEIINLGKDEKYEPTPLNREDLATLIYTSGTTGQPKGVMLTHYNLMSQIKNFHPAIQAQKGKSALCVLPIWHAYERTIEYYLISQGVCLNYTSAKHFKKDFKKYKPNYLISVPRIWESIYNGIQHNFNSMPKGKKKFVQKCIEYSVKFKNAQRLLNQNHLENFEPTAIQKMQALVIMTTNFPIHSFAQKTIYKKIKSAIGEDFILGISGGGALAKHLDDFFDAIGIDVFNGYGLTESSPVVSVRTKNNKILGSIGVPINETKVKVCNPQTMQEIRPNEKGVLLVKGPQVMKGYYKNPDATKEIIDNEGWLNTGDLVRLAPNGSIIITGRAKDTIVLSNGENIEPQGIEDVCLQSPLIKQIVLTGQDQPSLGALVVPDYEYIQENMKESQDSNVLLEKIVTQEVKNLVQSRPNYQNFERVSKVKLVNEEFSHENGLMTQTMKIKRNKVFDKYSEIIKEMFL